MIRFSEMTVGLRILLVPVLFGCSLFAAAPVNLIFDTDMGNDIDDTLALAMIHSFVSKGEARLLAVTTTKDNRLAGPAVDVLNTFYGRPQIPIGVVKGGKTPEDGPILSVPLAEKLPDGKPVYPHRLADGKDAPDAVALLRRVLGEQPDGSVTIVQVGFSTNLARLLKSNEELIRKKVKLLVAMAGNFAGGKPEYNVYTDLPAAKYVFEKWPTSVILSGFEVGEHVLYPAKSIESDYRYVPHHPVAAAYRAFQKMPYNRPTWDLTAAFYATLPGSEYFDLSEPGTITVDAQGNTQFKASAVGRARYLKLRSANAPAQLVKQFCELASRPPDRH